MSAIHHPTIKSQRRDERNARPNRERRRVSTIDLESSRDVLCEIPKRFGGLRAPGRKYLMRSRESVLVMPVPVVRPMAVRLTEKLASLPLAKVIRRRAQFARRAAGAKYQLEALSPGSKFRPAVQAVQDANLFAFKQAQAELDARYLHATQQLA